MALTPEQLAQAERLNAAVAWVYPDTSNTAFWDNYFNGPDFTLTQQEQDSGISLGPLPAGARPTYPSRSTRAAAPAPAPAPLAPITIGPTPVGGYDYLQASGGLGGGSMGTSTGYSANPTSVGSSGTFDINTDPSSYQSNLIQALRSSYTPQINNPGVNMMAPSTGGASVINALRTPTTGMANNPGMLNIQQYTAPPPAPQTQNVTQQPQVLPPVYMNYMPGAGLTAGSAGLYSDA